ncbi:MAG TPA: protein translocase subunit SecD [Gemmataceae bacterium]|nr:protein translocase subunit SecD [Gemmataceae bacterium]
MKHFFWKFVLCLIPCALAAWATADATYRYYEGEPGGFKFGVDLVGGTILVYEIDLRKNTETGGESNFDPRRDINVLAESLKRRIDPNDLYNITIRPAGGEGRIEIILPTGGTYRAKKAEENWDNLLRKLEEKYFGGKRTLDVGRGKLLDLTEQIQRINSETLWEQQLFKDPGAWKRLQENALDYWARLKNDPDKIGSEARIMSVPVGNVDELSNAILESLAGTSSATTQKTIDNWLKMRAWQETMYLAREKWKFLEPAKEEMERITPDSVNQLTTFIASKGNIVGQSALALIQPLVGNNITFPGAPKEDEIRDFIKKHYGPPAQEILDEVNRIMAETHQAKDMSVEDVQRIKDLVSKVGSLEFRILANDKDDAKAIEDAKKVFQDAAKNAELAARLKKAAQEGLPPPGPMDTETGKQKRYKIATRGAPSIVTYSWVELGPQERRALNLDNAARTDSARSTTWQIAKKDRDKAALQLPDRRGGDKLLLQGALFYSRDCVDRNLPEDERRKKEVEYFVLTRDPEFDQAVGGEASEVRTPKIDGSYLVNAYGHTDVSGPTVHFQFNNTGGELFGNITRKNISEAGGLDNTKPLRHLAIILDGLVMSAPTINSEIRTQGQISGNFTQKEVDQLVNILRAGRLPATLKSTPVSESTIAATLGEDTIHQGVLAILYSFGAVLLFMVIYYRFAGFVASLALMANLLITVGFMVAVQATFTLSGLAGIVLTLGMAVDANVLIYERLREERERGASLIQAIRNGYDRALPTIIDTHLSSIFTAIVLYVVGNDNLKGFAISMTVGLIISLFTSLYMTRVMFDYWQYKGWLTKLSMMRLFAKPDLDFMSIRHVMFAATLAVSIAGLALFVGRIPNDLNIDFVGGTAYGAKLTKGLTVTQLRNLVSEKTQRDVLKDPIVKEVPGSDGHRYDITFPKGDGKPRTVVFSHVPKGDTPEDRIKNVTARASLLPEPSVELLYNRTDDPKIKDEIAKGESRNFVVRTTEKEAELVQACLDQLLRDEKGELLRKVYAHHTNLDNREAKFTFYDTEADAKKGEKPNATASPSFVKSLLNRELRRVFGVTDDKKPLPFVFEVTTEGKGDSDGKYGTMKVTFSQDLKEDEDSISKVNAAMNEAANAFAARPLPDRLENFDSALASETRYRAMWAIVASWAAMLVYLWFRFGNWTFGLAAVICLIHDLCFTLGAIAAAYYIHTWWPGNFLLVEDFKLDLTSIAALLTLVGYSCSDTIVVFDRIREVRGKNPDLTPKMLNDSVNQTLSRTILASLTVWLVVFVLYCIGGPGVHLFAFVMVIGVIVGTYSSIYIAAPLLLMFGEGKHEDAAPTKTPAVSPEGAVV